MLLNAAAALPLSFDLNNKVSSIKIDHLPSDHDFSFEH
jgi:hypothetical protein